MTCTLANPSALGSAQASFAIRCVPSITIGAGSVVTVTLPSQMGTIASSSVTGGNGLAASTTTSPSTGNYRLSGAFLTDRPVSVNYIEVLLNNMINPIGMGSYTLTMAIQSTGGCTYSSGTATLVVDKIPSMTSVALRLSNSNRNLYETYTFAVTPSASNLNSGDYLVLTLPSTPQQVLLSQLGVVVSIVSNANLLSLSSQVVGASKIRLDFSTSAAGYAANKTLEFSMKYLRNPDFVGDVAGFVFQLFTSSNLQYENFTNLIQTYTNFITATSTSTSFSNSYVGLTDSVTYNLQLDTQLLLGTKIMLTLSDKFEVLPASTQLLTSSIPATLQATAGSTNQIVFTLTSDVAPGTIMTFTLRARNPLKPLITSPDVLANVTTADGKQVSAPVLFTRQVFSCDVYCADCIGMFSNCTACISGYYLSSARCVLQTEVSQAIPPFVFAGIGVALFLLLLLLGGGCDVRNYWCNMLYPLFKLDMFAFLIYFAYSWSSNLLNVSWFRYVGYAALFMHFVLGWWFLFLIKSDTKVSAASFESVEQNGHRYPLTKAEEEIGSSEESLEQEFNGSVKFTFFAAFLISVAMPRWLFSARGKSKGFFWYLAENDFSQLKHHLNIYQFLYFLFVLIPITAMSAYQLYQTWGANGWKNYLVEMGLMTVLDILYFILAFCELLSPPKKGGKKIFSKNDKYAVAKDINAADSSAILQGGPLLDNTIRDDEASPKKVKQTLQIEPQQTSIIVGAASVKPTNLDITRPTVFEIRTDKRPSLLNSAPQKLDQVRLQRLVEYDPKSSRLASPSNNPLRESKLNSFVLSPAAGNKTPRTVLGNSQLREQKLNMAGTSTIVIAGKTPKKQSNYSSINKDIFVPLPPESESVMGVTEANSLTHSGTNVLAKKKPVLGVRVEDLRPKQPAAEFKLAPHPISGIMRPQPIEYGVISEKEDLKIPQKKNSLRFPYGNSSGYFDDEEDGQLTQRQGMELSIEDDEEVFKYISRREDYSNPSHIKVPKKSRFLENQLFSKWGFARSDPKRYYEIIYEEDDKDKVSLKENPLYDPYPKRAQQRPKSPENSMQSMQKGQVSDSAIVAIDRKPPRIVLEPQRMPARVAPAELESTIETTSPRVWKPLPLASPPVKKIINGQLESDLQRGILRDRNKKVLDLNNQPDLNPFESGRFTTEDPRVEFELPSQPPRQFSKGIMKDSEGRVFRIADQDFELLAQGITLGRDGKPDNFNGQRPEEVHKGLIRDRDGEYLNLNKIKPDDYRKGTFVTEASRKVEIGAEQDPEKIKVGLVTAPDGNDYRMKDQKFEEIHKAGVFRDRNLIPLLLKKLPDTIYEEESELEDDYEIPEKPPAALSQIKVTDSSIRNSDGVPRRPEAIPRIAIDTAFKQKPVPGPSVMEKKEEGAYYVSPRHSQKHNPSNDDGTSGREDAKKPPKVILKKNPTGPKPAFIKAEDTKMPNKNVELENPNSRSMNESSRQQDPNMETNGHSRPESGKNSHKMDSQKNLESRTPRVVTNVHEPKKHDPRDSSPRVEVVSPGRQARVEEPTMRPVNSQLSAIKNASNPAPYEQARISPKKPKEPVPESRDRYQRVMTPTDPQLEDYIVGDPQQQSDRRVSKPSTGEPSDKQTPQKTRNLDEERDPINSRTEDQKNLNNQGKIRPIKQDQRPPDEKVLGNKHHTQPEDEEDDGKKQSTKNLSAGKPLSNRPPVPVSYAKAENPAQVEQQVPGRPHQNPIVTTKEGPKPLKRLSLKKKDSSQEASREDNTAEMKPSVKSKNLEIDEIQSDKSKVKDTRRVSHDDGEELDNRAVLVDDHDDGRANKHDESDELPVRQSPKSQARQENLQNGDNVRPIGQQNNLKGIMNPDREANLNDPFSQSNQASSQRPRNSKNENINKLMAHRDDTSKMDSLADLIEGDVESKFYTRRGTIEGTDPNEPNFGQTGNYTDKYPDLPSRGFRDAQDPERELSSIKMEGDEDRGSHLGRNSPIHRKSGSTDPVGQNQNHRNTTGPDFNKTPQDKRPFSSAGAQPPKPRAREMSVDQSGEKGSNVVPEPRQNPVSKIARNDEKYQPAEHGANPDSPQHKPPSVQVAQAKHPSMNAQNPNKSSMPADLSKTASQLPPKNIKQRVQEPQSARIPANGKDDKPRGERSLDPMTNFAESPRSNSVRRKDSRGSDIDDRSKPRKPAGPSEFPLINSTLPKFGGEESVDSPEVRRDKMPPLPKIAQSSGSQPHARPSEQHRLPGGQRSNGMPSGKLADRDGNPKSVSGHSRENSELPIITNPQSQRKPGSGQDRSNPNDVVAESLPNNANPHLRQMLKPFGVPGQPLPVSDTMYLDLVMDESLDIELNIEEMEDEEDDPDQPGQGQKRKVEPQYEIIGMLKSSNPEHPPVHSPLSHRGVSRSPSRTSKFGG